MDWALAGLVLAVGVLLSILVRRAVVALLRRGTSSAAFGEVLVARILQAVLIAVALVYALSILGVQLAPLLGALGIGGLAVALALQPTMENLFAGVILHAQRPARVGDEVVTSDIKGEVVDITSRAVAVRRGSGEIVFIPNSVMIGREIENLSRYGQRRTTLAVGVAYGSDLAVATEVVRAATAGCPAVLADPVPVVFVNAFGESSVDLDVDFWHGPTESERREARSQVVAAVHTALGRAGITIPFPQRTLWTGAVAPVEDVAGPTD